jgi:hypothetical protein
VVLAIKCQCERLLGPHKDNAGERKGSCHCHQSGDIPSAESHTKSLSTVGRLRGASTH